jgi:hypothetical protein
VNTTIASRGLGTVYDPAIASAAGAAGVEVALVKAVIAVESAWDPGAVNPADPSYGLMQVNTRAHPDVSPAQMLDPAQNIAYGTAYLAQQLARYGFPDGVSAYNAGRPISGNAGYVRDVLAYQAWYQANDPASASLLFSGSVLDTLIGPTDVLPGDESDLTRGADPSAENLFPSLDLGTAVGVPMALLLVVGAAWWLGRR